MKNIQQLSFLVISLSISSLSFAQAPTFQPRQPMPNYPQYPSPYGQMPQQYPYQQMPQFQYPQTAVPKKAPQTKKPFKEFSGYIGIVLDVIPPSVRAQLPDGVTQGILVKEFSPDSPAVSSDLKPFDVIYAYDETKLNHPSQFIKIVRDDKPGRTVKLKVVRKGQIMAIPVTLGSQKTPNPKEFNGLAIKQRGENTYEALIRFVGANGNKQMRSYKGTREEIFQQALDAQDLPEAERQQLLYATRPRKGNSNSGFGSFFPFGGKNESGKDWMNPSRFFKW